jgi:hypothetical protein
MEVKSERKTVEVHYTDIDVTCLGGLHLGATLVDGTDSYVRDDAGVYVIYGNGEILEFYRRNMLSLSIRKRTVQVPVKQEKQA